MSSIQAAAVWLLPSLLHVLSATLIHGAAGFSATRSLPSSTKAPTNLKGPRRLLATTNDACMVRDVDIEDERQFRHLNSRGRKRARRRASVQGRTGGHGRAEVVEVDQKHYRGTLSRRLSGAIWACGSDWERASDLLYDAYPFLRDSKFLLSPSLGEGVDTDPVCQLESFRIDGKSISSAIEVMGRAKQLGGALKLLNHVAVLSNVCNTPEDEDKNGESATSSTQLEADVRLCYRAAISAAGMCGKWRVALKLLQDMPARVGLYPKADLYHVVISACGRCGAVDAALLLVAEMESGRSLLSKCAWNERVELAPPKADRMVYQTAITCCMRNKRCDEAARLLLRMKRRCVDPDISQYNQVLSAYAKTGGRHKDAIRLLEEVESDANVEPNDSTYNLVISACGKDSAWKQASYVMSKMEGVDYQAAKVEYDPLKENDVTTKVAAVSEGRAKSRNSSAYFGDLGALPKLGVGNDACWEVARYARRANGGVGDSNVVEEIIVGLQPHRNPVRNGVSLIFIDGRTGSKMGFMLLRKTAEQDDRAPGAILFSSLVGMLVDESHRGKGLSNIFVAIWLQLCIDVGAFPRAEMIKKPLISVVLDRFGFVPQSGGVAVEVSPVSSVRHVMDEGDVRGAKMVLYNPIVSIEGIYGKRELRVQRMVVSHYPPRPRGRLVHVKAGFDHPVFVQNGKDGYGEADSSSSSDTATRNQAKEKGGWGQSREESQATCTNSTSSSASFICERRLQDLRRRIVDVLGGSDGSSNLRHGGDTGLLKGALFGFITNANRTLYN